MEYLSCPTCGYFLGQKSIEYDTKKEKICESRDLSEKEKELKIKELLVCGGGRKNKVLINSIEYDNFAALFISSSEASKFAYLILLRTVSSKRVVS